MVGPTFLGTATLAFPIVYDASGVMFDTLVYLHRNGHHPITYELFKVPGNQVIVCFEAVCLKSLLRFGRFFVEAFPSLIGIRIII